MTSPDGNDFIPHKPVIEIPEAIVPPPAGPQAKVRPVDTSDCTTPIALEDVKEFTEETRTKLVRGGAL